MYQNYCKKCGSTSLHTEVKGNNTGLYCDDCGAWLKRLGKDELRAFEHSQKKKIIYSINSKEFDEMIDELIESCFEIQIGEYYCDSCLGVDDVLEVLNRRIKQS